MENQTERFQERIDDYRKIWKLSPMDLESTAAGTTSRAPATPCSRPPTRPNRPGMWWIRNDQRRGRLNCIAHLLSLIPYEEVPHEKVKLPKRQERG